MKIVQTFWTAPLRKWKSSILSDGNSAGWPEKKYNYFSWALSALQFSKFYSDIELITDTQGHDLLIERIGLPYTSVKVELDALDKYHPHLFAIAKIFAYQLQEEPFIHADGDVYIWEKFSKNLENAMLVCQSMENTREHNRWYASVFSEASRKMLFTPPVLSRYVERTGKVVAVNAGILGGRNISFYKIFCKLAFEYVDKNTAFLERINLNFFNTIFEQFLFYALAQEKREPLEFYRADIDIFSNDMIDFTGVPSRNKYIHAVGPSKRQKHILDAIEYRLQLDFPLYYYKIIDLLRSNRI